MRLTVKFSLLKNVLTLGIAIYCAWYLSTFLWLFVPFQANAITINQGARSDKLAPSLVINMKQVVALNLFGTSVQQYSKSGIKEKQITAPETSLNLKLRGLRKGQGKIKSSAIIENARGIQNIYYLADAIEGRDNVTIYEIYSQRLILQRGGKFETLTLFDVLQKQKNPVVQTEPEKVVAVSREKVPVIEKTRSKKLTKNLSTLIDTLKTSPLSLSGTMIIEPVESNGSFQGYRVAPGKDKVLFARLGLVKGDLITQVNEVEITSSGKIMSLIGVLSSANELEVKVLRRGQPLAFRYKVN